jgi:hypothetical protein
MRTFSRAVFVLLVCTLPSLALADGVPTVNVPDHCTVTDTDGVSHSYTGYLGICAVDAAVKSGAFSNAAYSNQYPSFGLFLVTVSGVTADSNSQYWALYHNGGYSLQGLTQMNVAAGDTINLQLDDFSGNFLGQQFTFNVGSLISSTPAPTGGGSTLMLHDPFDVSRALAYIRTEQKQDGSFGSALLDDWVAIASSADGAGDLRASLSAYEVSNPPIFGSTTDYERHAMALEALGINPYSGSSVDTITPIVQAFDGTQIGDPSLDNDDIFAIFPLLHAGYTAQDPIIASTTAFIISRQRADGSWDGNPDLTGAALQALSLVHSLPNVPSAVQHALGYLRSVQKDDGGFGNASATSWAIQGLTAVGDGDGDDWSKGSYHVPDYALTVTQDADGGVGPESDDVMKRVWTTAYVIPAIKHKTWDELLASFPKFTPTAASEPAPVAPAPAVSEATTTATNTDATTAPSTATDTPPVPAADVPTTKPGDAATPSSDTPTAPSADSQPAAAASAFDSLWSAIAFFFSRLF